MTGIELIAAERTRQVEVEKRTPEHDREHHWGELADAAACYAFNANERKSDPSRPPTGWPSDWDWNPKNPIRDLIRAGALIAAEIDRRLSRGEQA